MEKTERSEKQAGMGANGGSDKSPMTREEALQKRYQENLAMLAKKKQVLTSVSNELTTMQIDIEASRSGSQRLSELVSKHDKTSLKKEKKDRDFVDKLYTRLRTEQDKIRDLGLSISRLEGQLVELRIDIELADSYVASLERLIGKRDMESAEQEEKAELAEKAGNNCDHEGCPAPGGACYEGGRQESFSGDMAWTRDLPAPHHGDSLPFPSAKGMETVEIEDAEPGEASREPEIRID